MPVFKKQNRAMSPARILVLGFFIIILAGALLLMLPFSAKNGKMTDFIDCAFTAASATCVTGITIYDTFTHWSIFGQSVIMLLIQVGGVGFLTLVTFFNLALGRKMGLVKVKELVSEYSMESVATAKSLFSRIVGYSLFMEILGSVILCIEFVPHYGGYGVFMSSFLSVSAFCNGGFDLLGIEGANMGLANYISNPLVLITLFVLIVSGGLGFIVWKDLVDCRKTKRLTLHTKVVLITTAALIVFGAVMYFIVMLITPEKFGDYTLGEKALNSCFASASARTAGMTAAPLPDANDFSEIITMLLMFIGAAPASTGGGIKVTTVAIIAATILSVIKNKNDTHLLGHSVKKEVVYKTLTVFALSIVFVLVAFTLVYLTNDTEDAVDVLFETVSAFSTTGFSKGVSANVNLFSKVVIILTMFVGRIGPVSLMLSLIMNKSDDKNNVLPESTIMVG